MALEQITLWRTSDGTTFEDHHKAFEYEQKYIFCEALTHFFETIEAANDEPHSLAEAIVSDNDKISYLIEMCKNYEKGDFNVLVDEN